MKGYIILYKQKRKNVKINDVSTFDQSFLHQKHSRSCNISSMKRVMIKISSFVPMLHRRHKISKSLVVNIKSIRKTKNAKHINPDFKSRIFSNFKQFKRVKIAVQFYITSSKQTLHCIFCLCGNVCLQESRGWQAMQSALIVILA